jgi:hypothetical protein
MEIVAHVQIGWKINMMENLHFYLNEKEKLRKKQGVNLTPFFKESVDIKHAKHE